MFSLLWLSMMNEARRPSASLIELTVIVFSVDHTFLNTFQHGEQLAQAVKTHISNLKISNFSFLQKLNFGGVGSVDEES